MSRNKACPDLIRVDRISEKAHAPIVACFSQIFPVKRGSVEVPGLQREIAFPNAN
jgi:hypothetical protein